MKLTRYISFGYSAWRDQYAKKSRSIFGSRSACWSHIIKERLPFFIERLCLDAFCDRLFFTLQNHGQKGAVLRGLTILKGIHPFRIIVHYGLLAINSTRKANPRNPAEERGAGCCAPKVMVFTGEYRLGSEFGTKAQQAHYLPKRVCAQT